MNRRLLNIRISALIQLSAMFIIKAERIAPVMLECFNVRIRARAAGETAFLARARKRQVPMTCGAPGDDGAGRGREIR